MYLRTFLVEELFEFGIWKASLYVIKYLTPTEKVLICAVISIITVT